MTPAVLQYRALEHWDGKLPEYNAGQLPLLTFDVGKLNPGMTEAVRQKLLKEMLDRAPPAGSGTPPASPSEPR